MLLEIFLSWTKLHYCFISISPKVKIDSNEFTEVSLVLSDWIIHVEVCQRVCPSLYFLSMNQSHCQDLQSLWLADSHWSRFWAWSLFNSLRRSSILPSFCRSVPHWGLHRPPSVFISTSRGRHEIRDWGFQLWAKIRKAQRLGLAHVR